jgi:glutamate dehydrogenase (NAD(P)+)
MNKSNNCDPFELADQWGPYQVLHIHRPNTGLKAIVVVDNVSRGPAIGGTRMAPDVSLKECARLARAMTFKNAAAGLSHGGAKSVIFADPGMPVEDKELLIRNFASAIANIEDYIPGPDMGTNEQAMAWVHDEIGRAVGLPREIGGIPLDEIGATGLGVAVATEVAQEFCDVNIADSRMAIQGFGAVGQHAARFLGKKGATMVAASDSSGTVYDPQGIDIEQLIAFKNNGSPLSKFPDGTLITCEAIVGVDCDIWIPAARPDVLHKNNVHQLKAQLVVQGANIPATLEAEEMMDDRGILCIPDFIANSGGVICAAVEFHGGSEQSALNTIAEKIERNTRSVLSYAKEKAVLPRTAAEDIAARRIHSATKLRRWS